MLQSQSGKRTDLLSQMQAHINPLIPTVFFCVHSCVTGDSFVCSQLGTAYVSATTGAVATALGLNALTKVSVHLTPFCISF